MGGKYTIGIDFGTLSGRAVLVEVATGNIIAEAVKYYTHAVLDTHLPNGIQLPPDWALQHPHDYLEVLKETVPQVIKQAGVNKDDVIGIGVDFAASTFMPVKRDGTPLCILQGYRDRPHAYVKLYKHQAAPAQADRLNEIASRMGETWLSRYGGRISPEWQVPKVMQLLEEDPQLYLATDFFMEATDWVVMMLSGKTVKNKCAAGYKGIWHYREGYPSTAFYQALHPGLENYVREKLDYPWAEPGQCIGTITPGIAKMLGLSGETAVATGNVDTHVCLPGAGISGSGKMLMIIGGSACDILLAGEERVVPGIHGVVKDGDLPGYFGYEAAKSNAGDLFQWMVEQCVSANVTQEAVDAGLNIHEFLMQKAGNLKAGESGLLALDWWNGNHSVPAEDDLTGMMLGLTLRTKPEQIYRALIEATAFGQRKMIEAFENSGIPVHELHVCGGIVWKNRLIMQIYADITGKNIRVSDRMQTAALGSAIFAAVAAGLKRGGYESITDAVMAMNSGCMTCYTVNQGNKSQYDGLYAEYKTLCDYFGYGGNDVMKRLNKIRTWAEYAGTSEKTS